MTTDQPRLRVAVVLSPRSVPAWIGTLVARLRSSPSLEVSLYRDAPAPRPAWPWAYRAYERADARIFRARHDALAPVALPDPQPGRLALLEECDVVVDLGSDDPHSLVGATRYGVWVLSHIDEEEHFVPPLFWEMHRRTPYRTTLEAHLCDGGRRLLYSSLGRTDPTSLQRSRNEAYWKAQGAIARALVALAERGRSYLESRPPLPERRERAENGPPRTATVARHAVSVALGVVGRRLRKLALRQEWFVATRSAGRASLVDQASAGVDGFRPLATEPGEDFADPFLLEDGGKTYVFFERYDERARRASIGCAVVGGTAEEVGPPVSVLSPDYHVSYPFVFRHGDGIFMIPESLENQTVDLYRALEFPLRWVLEQRLLSNVRAVDATLLDEGTPLWLFVNVAEPGASVNDELHVYHSTDLAGPWVAHPENPVVSDVARARPAGRVFRHHGQLIRPSQDCSGGYGTAVVFNRVDVLTPEEYRETSIGRIDPNWARGLVGTHTYNSTGRLEVVDGRRLVPRRLRWTS
jgi:hypothetical protein